MVAEDEDQEACDEVAADADVAACTASMPEFCASTPPTVPPGANSCTALQTCCAMLDDEDDQQPCDEVASGADGAACTESLPDFCASTPPTVPPGTDACSALKTCCGELDDEDDQEACGDVASEDDEGDCRDALADLCSDDDTMPTDPGAASCEALQSCCAELDDEDDQEQCEEVVSDADPDACAEAGADFCR
jgi:hypothetical protein